MASAYISHKQSCIEAAFKLSRRHLPDGLGFQRFYLFAPDVRWRPEELPDGWGALIVTERGLLEVSIPAPRHLDRALIGEVRILICVLAKAKTILGTDLFNQITRLTESEVDCDGGGTANTASDEFKAAIYESRSARFEGK